MNNYVISQVKGFFINEDGLVTNAHVITLSSYENFKYEDIQIKLNYADSNVLFNANIVDYDINLDLAIFKIEEGIGNLKYINFLMLQIQNQKNIKQKVWLSYCMKRLLSQLEILMDMSYWWRKESFLLHLDILLKI